MTDTYYSHQRREIEALLPASLGRVLDVGCGGGGTLGWLKGRYPEIETTGVEYSSEMRAVLSGKVDHVHIGPIDEILPQLGSYDTILCLDVLEHLPDADETLKALTRHLAPNGCFIISLPNVAHLSVSIPLLMQRRFDYADAGLLDRTHLRFFTEHSIVAFVNGAGLRIEKGQLSGLQGPRARLLDRLTVGRMRHHLTKQYLFRAHPGDYAQPPIQWAKL